MIRCSVQRVDNEFFVSAPSKHLTTSRAHHPRGYALAKPTCKSTQACKPELVYGLATGGQTESQVGSQAHANNSTFHVQTYLRSICVDLRWVAKRRKNLRQLAYEFELEPTQVNAGGWPNLSLPLPLQLFSVKIVHSLDKPIILLFLRSDRHVHR